jgi:peroxiredoxin
MLVAAAPGEADKSRTTSASGPLKVGSPCPSFAGFALDGQMLSLSQMLKQAPDTVLVVSFFATWCKPCRQRLPVLMQVVDSLRDKGARGVLVAYGETAEVVKPFAEENKLTLPIILDPFTKIAGRLGVDKALPRTVVIDAKGNVRTIFESEGDDFEQALRQAIAGSP